MESKQEKELLLCALLLVGAVVVARVLSSDSHEKKSAFCGDCKSESCNECSSNASGSDIATKETQKWVYTIEDNKDFCRWYDKDGRNTRTFNSKCSRSQANMGQGAKKK